MRNILKNVKIKEKIGHQEVKIQCMKGKKLY